jgi:hypothetical protein
MRWQQPDTDKVVDCIFSEGDQEYFSSCILWDPRDKETASDVQKRRPIFHIEKDIFQWKQAIQ